MRHAALKRKPSAKLHSQLQNFSKSVIPAKTGIC